MLVSSNSQVKKFGKPTWRKLVEAVEDKVGGDNPALAQTIAEEHPGAPGNHICSSLATYLATYVGDELVWALHTWPVFVACINSCVTCIENFKNKFLQVKAYSLDLAILCI